MKKLVLKKETIQGLSLDSLAFIQGGFMPGTQQACVNALGVVGANGQGANDWPPTTTIPINH